jgi:hypothetical protein
MINRVPDGAFSSQQHRAGRENKMLEQWVLRVGSVRMSRMSQSHTILNALQSRRLGWVMP